MSALSNSRVDEGHAAESALRLRCRSQIVIPARLESTRLPRKLLLQCNGRSILQHTYEAASRAELPLSVVVAVDSSELMQEVDRFGGKAIMTDPTLPSGTDRVVEAARLSPQIDVFVNVQGDEPEIEPTAIDSVIDLLQATPAADVATLATPIVSRAHIDDPARVKVVCTHDGRALYFSRSPIPFPRDEQRASSQNYLQHMGIYAYRREFLLGLSRLAPSPLEETEKLEQLRFLQAGCHIQVGVVQSAPNGIDTEDDYLDFQRRARV